MTWEEQKQIVRDAIERVLKIGEEKGVRKLSFSIQLEANYFPTLVYEVDEALIGEILDNAKHL